MSYYCVFGAKRRHAKTCQMVTFSCFCMATFRPATRKYDTFHASPFRLLFVVSLPSGVKGRHGKTRQINEKHEKVVIWRVFAWRPFAPPGKDTTNRGENAKGRHAKTRQMMTFSCFRMATFRPTTRKYATFHALRFQLLFVVSLPGEAKGRHAKTRQNHLLAGFRMRPFMCSTRKHVYTTWHKSATITRRHSVPKGLYIYSAVYH